MSMETNMNQNNTQNAIESGKTALGVEFGSTRIKAVLIGEDHAPLAAGSYEWENRYENGVWTYPLDDVWAGLQESYRSLNAEVAAKYGTSLKSTGATSWGRPTRSFTSLRFTVTVTGPAAPPPLSKRSR